MFARKWDVVMIGVGVAVATAGACGGGSSGNTGGAGATGGATSSTANTTTSVTTTGVTTGTGTPVEALGNACFSDADCGGSLTCITSDANDPVFGGGPAGGYCSKTCAKDEDCPGNSSACYKKGSAGVCVLTCDLGPDLEYLNDELSPDKCYGRNDLRCGPVTNSITGCLPTCGQDSQCPTGRVCDPRLAVCVEMATAGLPAGSKCDPNASQCAGICVNFTGGETSCSSPCVLGGNPADPADTPNCGGPTKGYCIYSPAGNGAGDFGFCAPGCKSQDECQYPSFWCLPLGGLTGAGVDNGFCLGAPECPNGASDCKNPDLKCTDTKFGPVCLPDGFPLGGAAPDVDAGTDGGSTSSSSSSSSSTSSSSTSSSSSGGTGGMGTGGMGTGGMGGATSASSSSSGP